jgi:flagellar basal body-associated protein FliL
MSDATKPKAESARSMWIAVGIAFALMAVAWAVLFTVAANNPVETVPLENNSQP